MNATIISPMDRVRRDLYAAARMKCRMHWLEVIVKRVHGFISIVAGVAVALSSGSAVLGAPTERVLYSFKAEPDGDQPFSEVIQDSAGNLYGTTLRGGLYGGCHSVGCGVVYKLSPDGI